MGGDYGKQICRVYCGQYHHHSHPCNRLTLRVMGHEPAQNRADRKRCLNRSHLPSTDRHDYELHDK